MAIPLALCVYLLYCVISATGQTVSTNIPVPPLQWINLSPLLHGSTAPPPLRDVALGYDESSRSLVVFGGESEGGFVQSQTYLLNMDTLTWSVPSPPANLQMTPPARCSAISATDIAASNRHAFIVIGGKGPSSIALSDVWAFDFTSQFWSQVLPTNFGPAPRWGASGGIDIRIPPIQDAVLPGPNNTIYLSGGFDGTNMFPLSDVWRLNISGTLSANLPDSVAASWEKIPLDQTLPSKVRQGGSVINQEIVSAGGCNITISESTDDPSCAQQDSYVVDVVKGLSISPGPCPAPRLDPVLIGNFNTYSTNFASQVLLALGTFNNTVWNGLHDGEIDILDANTGAWSRIIPSGDPGSTGQPTYPTPREGAAAFSYSMALVGSSRNGISDTIVFGGRDVSGNYLSDMWLLRSYRDSLSSSSLKWSGYGDGILQTGVNANGSGVIVEYLTTCPTKINIPPTRPDASSPQPSQHTEPSQVVFETGLIHKLFTSLSLALLLLSFVLMRILAVNNRHRIAAIFVAFFTIGAHLVGVVGFVFSFTSLKTISSSGPPEGRKTHLSTTHGDVALAFFTCLYLLVPSLILASFTLTRIRGKISDKASGKIKLRRTASDATNEKPEHNLLATRSPSISAIYSPPGSPRPRTQSATHPRRSFEGTSTDGESTASGPPRRGFEVLNRPPGRHTKPADNWATCSSQPIPTSRSLGDVDWLLRRGSLNAVGELDYALSLAHNIQRNSVATAGPTFPPPLHSFSSRQDPPSFVDISAYVLAQIGFLGLNIITLSALWQHAPRVVFILFLIWVVIFYILIIWVPRRFKTEDYLLSQLSWRSGGKTSRGPTFSTLPAPSPVPTTILSPPPKGPYLHQPPFSRTIPGDASFTSRGVEEDDEEEEMDEDVRQRMIEEEMDRREVSIITMPKRKLWVVNPSIQ